MRGPTLRQVRDWLGAPGWQGWSAIFSFLTLLAAISVAVILFRLTQQEEEKRLEAERPNFSIEVDLQESYDEPFLTTREWLLAIDIWNDGPAASTLLRVDFVVGGKGVEPVTEPLGSHGPVWDMGSSYSMRPADWEPPEDWPDPEDFGLPEDWDFPSTPILEPGEECFEHHYELRVREPVLPGDSITFWQWFSVDPAIDSDLLKASSQQLTWTEGLPHETLVGALLRSLTIQGPNIDLHHEWDYHDGACYRRYPSD